MQYARITASPVDPDEAPNYKLVVLVPLDTDDLQADAQYFGYQITEEGRHPFVGIVRGGKLFFDDGEEDSEIAWWSNLPSKTLAKGEPIAVFYKDSEDGDQGDLQLVIDSVYI